MGLGSSFINFDSELINNVIINLQIAAAVISFT